ncbi:glycosyltransferase family 39 protein [Planctomycetota bacterium]
MLIKTILKNPDIKQDIKYISILAAIALCVGIYLIATTVVIAKDGVTFIEYAGKLEISPKQTMKTEDQHPGYPAIISGVYRGVFSNVENGSISGRIYAAQAGALFYRLCAVFIIYLIARQIVGAKSGFVAVLILILLPKPAEYGSDALSDWPHMFFLATGMLLLIYGAIHSKWWMLSLAGLVGGAGYLIRPECAQVVIYGFLWLILQFFSRKRSISRPKIVPAIVFLLAGFAITAGPYMQLKGALFPKKYVGEFSSYTQIQTTESTQKHVTEILYTSEIIPSNTLAAIVKIFENIGDTLMWFFLLPLVIGLYLNFKGGNYFNPKKFFILALIALNLPIMIWLYCNYGYMSGRHTLPLAVFTIFYIPKGIQTLASGLNVKFSRGEKHTHRWFAILMIIGIAICAPKLIKPLHSDKLIYRQAAQWLSENTEISAVVAVPDSRIGFYAERESINVTDGNIPGTVEYIVELFSDSEHEEQLNDQHFEKIAFSENGDENNKYVIYKRISR